MEIWNEDRHRQRARWECEPFHNANTVFGQLVRTPAPRINTLKERNNAYTVRIDAMDCPSLQVVLPARKEVVENEFSRKLYQASRR